MKRIDRIRRKLNSLRDDIWVLFLACKDPRTPWYAKTLALIIIGYALSPIDLIPDFIPVLGYIDDLLLLPLGIWLTIRMIPPEVMISCRERARESKEKSASRWIIAGLIIMLWAAVLVWAIRLTWPILHKAGQ